MTVQKLSCPSCGAHIELPAELTRGHCVYCGSEVVVDGGVEHVKLDRADELEKSCRLLKTAMEAPSVHDVIRYADTVLEIDPEDSYAWYCKGVATCNLSSWETDRYEEGKTYLDKALEIDAENRDAVEMREAWPVFYIRYLYELSQQQWSVAERVWEAECLRSFGSIAQQKAAPYAALAHATVDKALRLLDKVRPSHARDMWEWGLLIKKMSYLNLSVTGGRFGKHDPYLRRAEELKAKSVIWEDVAFLSRLQEELAAVETEIADIEQGGGFFARRKLDSLRKQQDARRKRIMRAEELRDAEGTPDAHAANQAVGRESPGGVGWTAGGG